MRDVRPTHSRSDESSNKCAVGGARMGDISQFRKISEALQLAGFLDSKGERAFRSAVELAVLRTAEHCPNQVYTGENWQQLLANREFVKVLSGLVFKSETDFAIEETDPAIQAELSKATTSRFRLDLVGQQGSVQAAFDPYLMDFEVLKKRESIFLRLGLVAASIVAQDEGMRDNFRSSEDLAKAILADERPRHPHSIEIATT